MKRSAISAIIGFVACLCCVSCNKAGNDADDFPTHKTVSVADFIKLTNDGKYYTLKGTVKEITDNHYSQFVLEDKTGTINVSGLWESEGGPRLYDMGSYKAGDAISIAAQRGEYKGTPEAKNAFPYDPAKATLFVDPTSHTIGSEGGELHSEMAVKGEPEIKCTEGSDWASASFEKETGLTITIAANTSLEPRTAIFSISCGANTQTVRVSQDAYSPAKTSIAEAVKGDVVKVSGQIAAANDKGYVLADNTGAIFVNADSFLGLDLGTSMNIAGNVSTANYLTTLTPVTSDKGGKEEFSYNARAFDSAAAKAMREKLNGEQATAGRSLECVSIQARLVYDGKSVYSLVDSKTKLVIAVVDNSATVELSEFDLKTVDVTGYIGEYKDGQLHVIVGSIEEIPYESIISIDGDFSDWQNEAVPVSTTYDPDFPAVVEIRGYVDVNGVYFYYKSAKRSFLHNVRICVDIDADQTTGAGHWCLPDKGYEIMFNFDPFNLQGAYSALDGGDTLISGLVGSAVNAKVVDEEADTCECEIMVPRSKVEAYMPFTSDHINIALYGLGNPYWNKTSCMPADHALAVPIINE